MCKSLRQDWIRFCIEKSPNNIHKKELLKFSKHLILISLSSCQITEFIAKNFGADNKTVWKRFHSIYEYTHAGR